MLEWGKTLGNFDDFLDVGLGMPGASNNVLGWTLFGAMVWTIWLTRNDYVFYNNLCSSLATNIYKVIALLSQWTPLVLAKHRKNWDLMLEPLKT